MTDQVLVPTSDDTLLAAISHFFGLLVAFIVWITQKDRSRFLRFQSVQAMAFDLIVGVVILLLAGIFACVIFGALALMVGVIASLASQGNPSAEPAVILVALLVATPLFIPIIFIPIAIIVLIFRIIATIQTFQGKNYHYPRLGKWVEMRLTG